MTHEAAAVVITVHKPQMNELEAMSLSRCVAVLGRYPLVFAGPRSLDYAAYRQAVPSARFAVFDDRFFASLGAYSDLLTRPLFTRLSLLINSSHLPVGRLCFPGPVAGMVTGTGTTSAHRWQDDSGCWTGVGNGGFSLRKNKHLPERAAFPTQARPARLLGASIPTHHTESPACEA